MTQINTLGAKVYDLGSSVNIYFTLKHNILWWLPKLSVYIITLSFISTLLGCKLKIHLSSAYKYHFDKIKAKFEELTHTIVPLIARGIPSLDDVKMFPV